MLKILSSTKEYLDFALEINSDPDFSVPVYSDVDELRQTLLEAPEKANKLALGCFEGETPLGLFVFFVEEREKYLELLMALSKSPQAYEELFAFLKERYPGWQLDPVYNPGNYLLHGLLEQNGARFDTEQAKMALAGEPPIVSDSRIELYSPKYLEGYSALHLTDLYWTADKVLAAPERFRVILAVEHGEVAGYIDVTTNYDENEIFDFFVKDSCRRRGLGRALLSKAIELNRPGGMMLTVNVDNAPAIALYESMGFKKVPGQNCIVAHLTI